MTLLLATIHQHCHSYIHYFFTFSLAILVFGCGVKKPDGVLLAEKQLPDAIDFNFHVKPILADRCFSCHGPDAKKREANLRLDIPDAAYAALSESPGKFAIDPGNLKKSEVYHRIVSKDSTQVMPPPESHLTLSDHEKAILIKWIESGAKYKPHWAFIPPTSNALAKRPFESNEIDFYVRQRLKKENLSLAPKADKETLIRRVYFDLTGLPPTLKAVDDFLANDSPNAYEKVVDQLLASTAYGERMTTNWLDVARYTDSDGYLDDKHRDFSPWRDWVIKAFNENLPYDQFATWQIAGDLIPEATQEQILATAFNRLHKKNSEAGIVFEEYRVEYVADRTHTFGKAFLGLSYECARCHDHKYDPISHENYYQLFGFFNSTHEIGHAVYGPDQTPGPALLLTNQELEDQRTFLDSLTQQCEQRFQMAEKAAENAFESWVQSNDISPKSIQRSIDQSRVSHISFDKIKALGKEKAETPDLSQPRKSATLNQALIQPGVKGDAFFVTDHNSGRLPEEVGWFERTEPFSISLWVYPDTVYPEASIFTHCEDRRLGFKGYSLHVQNNQLQFLMAHSWPQNAIQITTKESLPVRKWTQITLTYDGSSKAKGVHLYFNGQIANNQVDFDHLYKGILFESNIHTYGFNGFQFGVRNKLIPFKNGGIDEIQVFDRELTALEVRWLNDPALVKQSLSDPNQENLKALLRAYYVARNDAETKTAKIALQTAQEKANQLYNRIPEIMVMGDLPSPRPTYILERGNYDQPSKEVFPGTPADIFPFPDELSKNRLGLAQWLFHPEHPLTARVIVNRIWQMHFGRGIVKTSEDFGNQGDLPSHPALLDWLAQWFVQTDWDLKALHKLIVMSETYQQSSAIESDKYEKDPENVLLARGPRFRLPAEMIRDNALAISGLLAQRTGGESVYPYQPEGLWDEISNKSWRYPYLQKPGEGLYRRSLYTIWKRTSPPPSMLIFDIANRDICTVRRQETHTPMQALVLLNDPQYQEAARVTAEYILTNHEAESRIETAFRLATGRKPDLSESSVLDEFLKQQREQFEQSPEKALAYLSVGSSDWNRSLSPGELAAWGVTINSIMNTDEGYTRK